MNPVALPPGRARLSTKPAPTGSTTLREHDRHGAGRLQQRPPSTPLPRGQDDVRRERDQFRRVSANVVGIGAAQRCRSAHCGHGPAQLLQPLHGTPRCRACDSGSSAAAAEENTDAPHPSGCCARAASGQRRRAAEQRDELAPVVAVGTCVSSHAPRTEPYVRLSRIRLVWGFPCQGCITPLFVVLLLHSFVRPAPRAFFRPDRILPSPSRAATVKDGASSAPPKACP